ncbi:MAG: aminoglycoside phosphotransferase family protein [Clostridia bacterium]|nr:aminoglycoside phosphotransferase family protein [Clostridia bacterium]
MSSIENTRVDPETREAFARFFEGTPVSADIIDTSRGEEDFRNTVIVTTDGGEKFVLKFAANDFTFPDKIRVWQRTVEEYRALGYYCPRIFCDKNGDFPRMEYHGHTCCVLAEEYSVYRSLEDRSSADEKRMEDEYNKYLTDIWSMTAKVAARRLDYTEYPSAFCLFETFCPSDKTDEVLENALEWKKTADALPKEFSARARRIWEAWSANRDALQKVYSGLPTSVFQADLNATNVLVDDEGHFMGVYDFNLCGREVFLNYLMRENDSDTIPEALRISSEHYEFCWEEKAAAQLMFRCLKPLWYPRVRELKDAGSDPEKISASLDKTEELLASDIDFPGFMSR